MKGKYWQYKKGLILNGLVDLFLYLNEKKEREFVSNGLLMLLGLVLIIMGVKKDNRSRGTIKP
jgi:hypothetical protein